MTITIKTLKDYKSPKLSIVCLTAYSYSVASILAPHVDLILVGDSLGMVLYGMEDTRNVTLEQMIAHGKAVVKGADGRCITVVDMSFGTYEESDDIALNNARLIMDETGCDAVKLEGGTTMASRIQTLTDNNIPVIAHIGLLPQSAADEGGFKIKGNSTEQAALLRSDLKAVENAGASAVVIEGTLEPIAKELSELSSIPTIGIGASKSCDGQILVTDDMIGLTKGRLPKFVKTYANISENIENAVKEYRKDVHARRFPDKKYTYN